MFQQFSSTASPKNVAARLKSLRAEMKSAGIDWLLVPHADEQQNEYLPACAERLAWLTGFTGSAGFAIVGMVKAFLFVDGRYTVQAARQTDTRAFKLIDLIKTSPPEFARTTIRPDDKVGFDPWLITIGQKSAWQETADAAKARLIPVDNLVDRAWTDRPAPPIGKAWQQSVRHAGQNAAAKLSAIRKTIAKDNTDCLLLTDPASIAWTFNLRGSDLIHNPLALAFAFIPAGKAKPVLFIDRRKLDARTTASLKKLAILAEPSTLAKQLANRARGKRVHCDPSLVAVSLGNVLEEGGATIVKKRDPVVILRAIKNRVELQGARRAHIRDGVAMVRFLAWLDDQEPGSMDEITAAKKLEQLRIETASSIAAPFASPLREISFDTISAAGPNAAFPHYRVTEASNAILKDNSLYLVDSGGQYVDGTTDITRTVAIGKPPKQAITDNTNVLKGHISIATARFPEGTRGVDLDVLARMALWQTGKDYAHGTGHGIGSYLNVHEGPQSLSRRGMEIFQPGMIVSNEPGYYLEGHYGIRIENLLIVQGAEKIGSGDRLMMAFETITLCPIDHRLIDKDLLEKRERQWLDDYHRRVWKELSPHLDAKTSAWLKAATKPL
jgi:Xaa-Pro aminopeptidase